jgi:response regulator RpfG family c-di-GMP phosphodiesterase
MADIYAFGRVDVECTNIHNFIAPMSEMILAVDDEPMILSAYRRNLGDQYTLFTAQGPEIALSLLRKDSFAVILSDLKMPGMDGVEFLRQAREIQPDAVRVMISGHADLGDAINSVNNAGIFRLMIKPASSEELAASLDAALEQHKLITAERALLEGTLNGAIHALTDILGIMDGEAFGQAQLRRQMAGEVARVLKAPVWEFEMAAQLAEIGRATLPPGLNEKIKSGQRLNDAEARLVSRIPEFSCRLLGNIPRIDGVARAILYQDKHYNGAGMPEDAVARTEIPAAARALHAINAMMAMCRKGTSPTEAVNTLKLGPEKYDPVVVQALHSCIHLMSGKPAASVTMGPRQIKLSELAANMVLLTDIVTVEGVTVLGAGTKVSAVQAQRVKNFAQLNSVKEPLLVEFSG